MTSPSPPQSFASGAPAASKYGRLGGAANSTVRADPHGIYGFIVGESSSGKSFLLQSCPDAFIINCDETSVVTHGNAPAQIWPLPDASGRFPPFSWEAIQEQKAILIELAKANAPRPRLVAIDSVTMLQRLLQRHIPPNARKYGLGDPVEYWRLIDGRSAYDVLYSLVLDLMTDLHNAGYGVWLIGHITPTKVPLGPDQTVFVPELNLGDGFWRRLYPIFELIVVANRVPTSRTVTTHVEVALDKSKPTALTRIPKTANITGFDYTLTFQDPKYAGIVKGRGRLPSTITLPERDAWSYFVQQYTSAPSTPEGT